MTLEERLAALVQAVGTDVKELRARDQIVISETEPILAAGESKVWVNSTDEPPTLWLLEA